VPGGFAAWQELKGMAREILPALLPIFHHRKSWRSEGEPFILPYLLL
jgi:hypothetical protein